MSSVNGARLSYGTSGFRANAKLMGEVVFRAAYFAGIYSRTVKKTLGLMITASHNPPEDNGVKLIDWTGGMLPMSCEAQLNELINAPANQISLIVQPGSNAIFHNCLNSNTEAGNVIVGTDTRESSGELLLQALKGLNKANASSVVFYQYTTPQLHFLVRGWNDRTFADPLSYVTRFRNAVNDFFGLIPVHGSKRFVSDVYLDCAYGVGALWIKKYFDEVTLINADCSLTQNLNCDCGADYVKILKKVPTCFEGVVPPGSRCASLDGDADRLVYFYTNKKNPKDLTLMDGDYISALFSFFIYEQLEQLKTVDSNFPTFSFGVIQTAYSNGNSTRFFKSKLGVDPVIVKTGVKYLEEAAHAFDIGVFFEANGHGTACFSTKFTNFLNSFSGTSPDVPRCIKLLYYFSRIVNQVVGDGIADFLAVESLLRYYNWSIEDWKTNTFESLPNVQLKVLVADCTRFETSQQSEACLVRPAGLQGKIETVVQKFYKARAFVRPSGTESIVRIFAEALTQEDANCLAKQLKEIVLNEC